MGDDRGDEAAAGAVAAFTSAVDDLLGLSVTSVPGTALIELSARIETQLRRMASFDHALVAALVESGVCGEVGARNTASLLVSALRVSPAEAAARVRAARELGPRTDFTGGPMEPLFPLVARAQADGVLSPAHARVITTTVTDLPTAVRGEHGEALEEFLTGQARDHAPDLLARTARHAQAVLDPDGTLASDEDRHRRRAFSLSVRPDGSGDVRGYLTPACTAVVRAVLDPLAAPAPATTGLSDTAAGDTSSTAVQAVPDPRTYPQRMHDALHDAGEHLLASGVLPDAGGVPSVLVITMTQDQLTTGTGIATTGHGAAIGVATALTLVDQADVIPVALTATGGIASYGRLTRHATAHQRRALAARDGGCSFPGCAAPPSWTQAHHIQRWDHGGPTNLDNLTLVCGYHHREHQRQGWHCHMTDGVPTWQPPTWIDPHQNPQRNQTHHPQRYLQPDAA